VSWKVSKKDKEDQKKEKDVEKDITTRIGTEKSSEQMPVPVITNEKKEGKKEKNLHLDIDMEMNFDNNESMEIQSPIDPLGSHLCHLCGCNYPNGCGNNGCYVRRGLRCSKCKLCLGCIRGDCNGPNTFSVLQFRVDDDKVNKKRKLSSVSSPTSTLIPSPIPPPSTSDSRSMNVWNAGGVPWSSTLLELGQPLMKELNSSSFYRLYFELFLQYFLISTGF